MEGFKAILLASVIFNLVMALFISYVVKRLRAGQEKLAGTRRKQMLEQGKIITAQENLLKSKQDLLTEKEKLLNEYRRMNE